MKRFDLKEVKAGAPVCTVKGFPVRILCFDRKGSDFPIVGLINENGVEVLDAWDNEGRKNSTWLSDNDLKMVDFDEDDESCVSDDFIEKLAEKLAEKIKEKDTSNPVTWPNDIPWTWPSDKKTRPWDIPTVMYGVTPTMYNDNINKVEITTGSTTITSKKPDDEQFT